MQYSTASLLHCFYHNIAVKTIRINFNLSTCLCWLNIIKPQEKELKLYQYNWKYKRVISKTDLASVVKQSNSMLSVKQTNENDCV
jgi:hypothetical protein